MASARFAPDIFSCRRIPLSEIDTVVSARLGPTRGLGNSQPTCFNRQVAMYMAKHVGRWTVAIIGRFYNGRDHSTVSYSIQRIEALRESDPQVDALITDLKRQLTREDNAASTSIVGDEHCRPTDRSQADLEDLAELIATRVCAYIEKRTRTVRQEAQTGQTYE
jgi:DnaA-like protein